MDATNARGCAGAILLAGWALSAQAGVVLIAGGPGYDANTGAGFYGGAIASLPGQGVNALGMAVGYATKHEGGLDQGDRAVRWGPGTAAAVELGTLGTDSHGATAAWAYAINDQGTAVGSAIKYQAGDHLGPRAVRWEGTTTAAVELGTLGTNLNGVTTAVAYALNGQGTAVGYAAKYEAGVSLGTRAVRWEAGGTTAVELGNLGTRSSGVSYAEAYAINPAGTAVGYANRYEAGVLKGKRAVRWDVGGTAATELEHLGTDGNGATETVAQAINSAGTVVGYATKYEAGVSRGTRAVRWPAGGTAASELGHLGVDVNGFTAAAAHAVSDTGIVVGSATRYEGGSNKGTRAVRWDAGGTVATELANLGTTANGLTETYAAGVNSAGTVVGRATKYEEGIAQGARAALWLPDATILDLNTLGVTPVSGGGCWTLTSAEALGADGWVAGKGDFDPDEDGPLPSYVRLWVAQIGLGGHWTNASGGMWGSGMNWSTGTPALQVGAATFALDAGYEVALDRSTVTQAVAVTAGTVMLAGNGHTLTVENGVTIAPASTLTASDTLVAAIINRGTFVLDAASGPIAVGAVDGDGDMVIGASAATMALITSHVRQDTLTIHAGSRLALQSSAGASGTSVVNFLRIADPTGSFAWGDLRQVAPTDAGAPNAGAAPVPEPNALWLLFFGGCAALACQVRRRH